MSQSRRMSLTEALTSTAVGYVLAVLTQILVFPLFGLPASFTDSLAIGAIFTIVSVARGYVVRRIFERRRTA
jgi:phosphate/sulfate permease